MIVVGASLGGLNAVATLLEGLPSGFSLPLAVVLHRHRESDDLLGVALQKRCALPVVEVIDKEPVRPGRVFLAPANYHLLLEEDHFSLSTDEPVRYARPSIDVLFESAADVFGNSVIGVVLTGSSEDGARGALIIQQRGGRVIAQDPATAECPAMPAAALAATHTPFVRRLDQIPPMLVQWAATTTIRSNP